MEITKYSDIDNCDSSFYIFDDKYLRIHKIKSGPNAGKYRFYIYDSENDRYIRRYSLAYGIYNILDTKYENDKRIHSFTIEVNRFKIIQPNTISAIINDILSNFNNMEKIEKLRKEREIERKYKGDMKEMLLSCNTLGECIIKIRDVVDEIKNTLIFDRDIKKFNI
jgi:hypothetical protein